MQVAENTKAYNLLWINPVPYPKGATALPVPQNQLNNVIENAKTNQDTDVIFWIDSKRLSSTQIDALEKWKNDNLLSNLTFRDLQSIPEYGNEQSSDYDFYQRADNNPNWGGALKDSLIWKQVDAAKILIANHTAKEEQYETIAFSDLDIILDLSAEELTGKLDHSGLAVYAASEGFGMIENQAFVFSNKHKFESSTQLADVFDTLLSMPESEAMNIIFNGQSRMASYFDDLYSSTMSNMRYNGHQNGHETFKDHFYNGMLEKYLPPNAGKFSTVATVPKHSGEANHPNAPRHEEEFETSKILHPSHQLALFEAYKENGKANTAETDAVNMQSFLQEANATLETLSASTHDGRSITDTSPSHTNAGEIDITRSRKLAVEMGEAIGIDSFSLIEPIKKYEAPDKANIIQQFHRNNAPLGQTSANITR